MGGAHKDKISSVLKCRLVSLGFRVSIQIVLCIPSLELSFSFTPAEPACASLRASPCTQLTLASAWLILQLRRFSPRDSVRHCNYSLAPRPPPSRSLWSASCPLSPAPCAYPRLVREHGLWCSAGAHSVPVLLIRQGWNSLVQPDHLPSLVRIVSISKSYQRFNLCICEL